MICGVLRSFGSSWGHWLLLGIELLYGVIVCCCWGFMRYKFLRVVGVWQMYICVSSPVRYVFDDVMEYGRWVYEHK